LSLWQKQKLHFFLKSLEKSTAGARGFLTLENQGYGADYAFCSPSVQQFLNKIGIVDFLKKKTCSNVGAALVKTWFLKPFSSLQNSAFKHRKKWMQFFENSVDEISLKKLQRALQELQPQHLHDFVFKSDTFQFCTHLKSLRNLVDTFFFVSVLLKNLNASTCDKFFSSHIILFNFLQKLKNMQKEIDLLQIEDFLPEERAAIFDLESKLRTRCNYNLLQAVMFDANELKNVKNVTNKTAVFATDAACLRSLPVGTHKLISVKISVERAFKKKNPKIKTPVFFTTPAVSLINKQLALRMNLHKKKILQLANLFYSEIFPNYLPVLQVKYHMLANIDCLQAFHVYMNSKEWLWSEDDGACSKLDEPEICGVYNLKNPQRKKNNEITMEFASEQRDVCVLGSNASGKSSLIKTILLNVILKQMALKTYGRICFPFFKQLLLRNPQDTELECFSSFYNQALQIRYVYEHSTKDSLVCFDEVGLGTNINCGRNFMLLARKLTKAKKLFFATHFENVQIESDVIFCEKTEKNVYTVSRNTIAQKIMYKDSMKIAKKFYTGFDTQPGQTCATNEAKRARSHITAGRW